MQEHAFCDSWVPQLWLFPEISLGCHVKKLQIHLTVARIEDLAFCKVPLASLHHLIYWRSFNTRVGALGDLLSKKARFVVERIWLSTQRLRGLSTERKGFHWREAAARYSW